MLTMMEDSELSDVSSPLIFITILSHHQASPGQGLYIGYDSISVLSQSVSLLQVYLLLELSSSSLLAGTGGNRPFGI